MNWETLNSYATLLAVAFVAIPIVAAAVQYFFSEAARRRRERFETYHELVKQLAGFSDTQIAGISVDHQITVAFELTNYPEYDWATRRIFENLLSSWSPLGPSTTGSRERLLTAISDLLHIVACRQYRSRLPGPVRFLG